MSPKSLSTGKPQTPQHEAVEFPSSSSSFSPDAPSTGGSLGRRSSLFKSTLKRPSLKSLRRSISTSLHLNSDSEPTAASESESTNPNPNHRRHHLLSLPSFHRHDKHRSFSQLGIGTDSTPRSTSSAGSGSDLEFDPDHDTIDTPMVHSFVVLGRRNRTQSENSVAQGSKTSAYSADHSTSPAGSGSDLEFGLDPKPDTEAPAVHSFVVLGRKNVNSVVQGSKEDTDALSRYILTPAKGRSKVLRQRYRFLPPLPLPAIDNIEIVEIGITRSFPSPSRVDGSVPVQAIVVLEEDVQLPLQTSKFDAPDATLQLRQRFAEPASPSSSSADNDVDVVVHGVPSVSYRELATAAEDVVISGAIDDTRKAMRSPCLPPPPTSGDIDTAIASRLVPNSANIDTIISVQLDDVPSFSRDGSELDDPHRCPEHSVHVQSCFYFALFRFTLASVIAIAIALALALGLIDPTLHSVHRTHNCHSEHGRKRSNHRTTAKSTSFIQEFTWLLWVSVRRRVSLHLTWWLSRLRFFSSSSSRT
ncbi:hypothetical protein BT96DRAFT_923342 [Gymnopus androsaceus JB14]|uniref:Uncharacterized protein n=1 Tax=Gymnopus androsaceus JB14 TaxID=1447944 RepID=A0A6A4H963_9AGAR|nr:hypothetical protein BT96DRAFT_923342 [Gymnopus androsaceus JB14]